MAARKRVGTAALERCIDSKLEPQMRLGEYDVLQARAILHLSDKILSAELPENMKNVGPAPLAVFRDKRGNKSPVSLRINEPEESHVLGFVYRKPGEDVDAAFQRQQAVHSLLAKDFDPDGTKNCVVPFYSPLLLRHCLQNLIVEYVRNATGTPTEDFQKIMKLFESRDLQLDIEETRLGETHIIFRNKQGVISPIPNGDFEGCVGFVVLDQEDEKGEREEAAARATKKIRSLSRSEYYVAPWDEEMRQILLDEYEIEFEGGYYDFVTQEEQDEFVDLAHDLIEYLRPHLHAAGMDIVEAKSILTPTQQDLATWQLVGRGARFPLVDYLLVTRPDQENGRGTNALQLAYPNLVGWDTPKNKDSRPDSGMPYGKVSGIVLVPEEMTLRERKELWRRAAFQVKRFFPTHPRHMVLTLDRALLEKWKRNGSPLVQEEAVDDLSAKIPQKKLADYGIYPPNITHAPEVTLIAREPNGPHIGGTQLELRIQRTPDFCNVVKLDMGWIFDMVPSWGNLGSGPSYEDGILPFLKADICDLQRRVYSLPSILKSLKEDMLRQVFTRTDTQHPQYLYAHFFATETFHRLQENGFIHLLQDSYPVFYEELSRRHAIGRWMKELKEEEKILYARKEIFDVLLSHAHQDHTLLISLLRPEILIGLHPIARALLLVDHNLASGYLAQDVIVRKQRELPMVGSAYNIEERPYLLFEDGVTHELSPGVFATGYDVYHSIPGSIGFLVDVKHRGKTVASLGYGGDYRDGRFFTAAGKHIREKDDGRPLDLLIIEGTNPPSAKKKSALITEDMIRSNFDKAFREADEKQDVIVIDLVKSAFERLANIFDVAAAGNRNLIFSPKIARRIIGLRVAVQGDPSLDKFLQFCYPGNPQIRVWKPKKSRYSTVEKEVFHLFGTVTAEDIARNPTAYVVVRENEQAEKLEGIGRNVTWIDSTYAAYSFSARQEKSWRRRLAKKNGYRLLTEGFHASGHTPILPPSHPDAERTAPSKLRDVETKRIFITHTQHREETADVIEQFVPPTTKVARRLNRNGGDKGTIVLFRGEAEPMR